MYEILSKMYDFGHTIISTFKDLFSWFMNTTISEIPVVGWVYDSLVGVFPSLPADLTASEFVFGAGVITLAGVYIYRFCREAIIGI